MSNFEELKEVRFSLLRSYIESKIRKDERPNYPSVAEIVETLRSKELNNPKIPDMLTCYFIDMEKCIE